MPAALILAMLASLGIHAGVLFGTEFETSFPPEPEPLQAELRPLPKALEPKSIEAQPVMRPPHQTAAPHAARARRPAAAPVLMAPASSEALPAAAAGEKAASRDDGRGTAVAASAGASALPDFPERGQIDYRLDRGDQGFEIGRALAEWDVSEGAYLLRLHIETSGIVWLLKAYRIDMESRGKLTAEGLQPESFSIRRNGEASGEKAFFDWQRLLVQVGDQSPQAVEHGAQDLLSFNFHLGFMRDPKVARRLAIATGKKYDNYRLETVGDEEIELPFGPVRTLHLRAPGENTTELWLAYDYLLLPVKIRHTDAKGGSFVQVATGIRLGEIDR